MEYSISNLSLCPQILYCTFDDPECSTIQPLVDECRQRGARVSDLARCLVALSGMHFLIGLFSFHYITILSSISVRYDILRSNGLFFHSLQQHTLPLCNKHGEPQ